MLSRLLAASSLVLLFVSTAGSAQQEIAAPDEEQLRQFLDRQLVSIQRQDDTVRFEAAADGSLARYDPARHQWVKTFTLAVDGRFFQQDHHGRLEFIVRDITTDGVLIEVQSLFNHHSFGSDKTTTGTTDLWLPYRDSRPGD